ncbi:MAG: LysR substrate-binding domain-containing protein [Burkholderiales bacterium]|nr:LysR substrate-binding domain-containing protein [Burkholderiales bacterium]
MRHATFRQLRIFEAAARHLNFSRAAEELFLTQPGVSATIRQLESMTGLKFFEQIGKRLHLTAAGSMFLGEARGIIERIGAAEEAVARFKGAHGGVLRIAAISAGNFFLPRLAARFQEQHPGVQLVLRVQQQDQLLRLLQDNQADIAIMGRPPAQPEFVGTPFAPHPYGFIVHPQHALAKRKDVPLDALRGENLITRQRGSDNRRIWDELMERRPVPLPVGAEMTSNEMLKEMTAAGLGVGFVSLHAVSSDLSQGTVVLPDIIGFPVMRRWYLVQHRDKPASALGREFENFIRNEGALYVNTLIRNAAAKKRVRQAVKARSTRQ